MSDKVKKLENVKQEIRSVLISQPKDMTIQTLLNDYRSIVGRSLPFTEFDYSSPDDFLRSIPDVVDMYWSKKYNTYMLSAVADETTKHIEKLVSKQKITKSSVRAFRRMKTVPPPRFNKAYNGKNLTKPYLPAHVKNEIYSVASEFKNGLSLPNFLTAFRKKFGKELVYQNYGFFTLEDCLNSIPEVLLRCECDEMRVYPIIEKKVENNSADYKASSGLSQRMNSSTNNNGNKPTNALISENAPAVITSNTDGYFTSSKTVNSLDDFSSPDEHSSSFEIPVALKDKFKQIMKKNPQGIWVSQFPAALREVTGYYLDHRKLGYYNLIDLFSDLPELFRIEVLNDCRDDWMLFDATNLVGNFKEEEPEVYHEKVVSSDPVSDYRSTTFELPSGIPSDAVVGCTEYRLQNIPEESPAQFFPVYLSAAVDPCHLYIQLLKEIRHLNDLMDKLEFFYYNKESEYYRIPSHYIISGIICAAEWPNDGRWHRIRISSVPSRDTVVAFFMDYGTKEKIRSDNLRFLRKDFTELPAQAIRSHLCRLRPSHGDTWDPAAKDFILASFGKKPLMAYLTQRHVKEDSLPLVLCDVSEENDVFVNDTLVTKGFAKYATDDAEIQSPGGEHAYNGAEEVILPADAQKPQLLPTTQQVPVLPGSVAEHPLQTSLISSSAVNHCNMQNPSIPVRNSLNNFNSGHLGPLDTSVIKDMHTGGMSRIVPKPSTEFFTAQPNASIPEANFNSSVVGFHGERAPLNSHHISHGSDSDVFESDEEIDDDDNPEVNSISKRYVKKLNLDDGYNHVHMIVLNDTPFMCSGDITYLLWNHDDPDFVRRKLKSKEIFIPNTIMKEVGYEQLFYQLERFQVRGVKTEVTGNHYITLFPFKNVIDILNIFGHPSIAIRDIIDNELFHFDPLDPFWKTISEEEFQENCTPIEARSESEQKVSLYELKASLQALKFRKQTLKNQLYSSASIPGLGDEIEEIEAHCINIERQIRELQVKIVSYQREKGYD